MKKIGMGLVGPGFVGAHHIDAVRRLGFVDVVAVAASSEASARRKADALGVPKAYGSFEALIADPDIQVVHNTTPNYLHGPVIMAALAHGKHVISDKPLATTADEARRLRKRSHAATAPANRSRSAARISRRSCCGSTAARRDRCRSDKSAPGTRTTCGSRRTAVRRRSAGGRSGRTSCGSAGATARMGSCQRIRRS